MAMDSAATKEFSEVRKLHADYAEGMIDQAQFIRMLGDLFSGMHGQTLEDLFSDMIFATLHHEPK